MIDRKAVISLILAASFLFLGSCTQMGVEPQNLNWPAMKGRVTSEPSGAKIYLYEEVSGRDKYLGKTPLYVELDPGFWYVHLRAEKEGYETVEITLPKKNELPYHFDLKKN